MAISFKGAQFPPDIILMGVRWYVAYPLSYRHIGNANASRTGAWTGEAEEGGGLRRCLAAGAPDRRTRQPRSRAGCGAPLSGVWVPHADAQRRKPRGTRTRGG
jgi:hypothetical protein